MSFYEKKLIEKRSEEYINDFLKSSSEYPLVSNYQRKKLITRDLFEVQDAYEDGYKQGIKDALEWISKNSDLSEDFIKAINNEN